jgi:uracil-DNA glycosylase family 4
MNHLELKDKYSSCVSCQKCQNDRKVFGAGNPKARIAVVGEGPGKDEVDNETPFVGASGQLLDKILAAVHINREDIFATNAILCRTDDKNRTPTSDEYRNCRNRLFEELSLINPRYTLLVGSTALKTIMGESYKVTECHGQWFTLLSDPSLFYFSIMHPAWILHSVNDGEQKAKKMLMWKDIKKFASDMETLEDWEKNGCATQKQVSPASTG